MNLRGRLGRFAVLMRRWRRARVGSDERSKQIVCVRNCLVHASLCRVCGEFVRVHAEFVRIKAEFVRFCVAFVSVGCETNWRKSLATSRKTGRTGPDMPQIPRIAQKGAWVWVSQI